MMASERGGGMIKWLVILALLGGAAWAGVSYWQRPKETPVDFKTNLVARTNIIQSVTANGSLTPVRMVEVGSQISGVITKIMVDFNSVVKSNDVVAQIDPATYERSLGQAEAELSNADAALELAQLNYDRAMGLMADNLISKSEFDQQRVNLSQAKAVLKTRQANVDRAKVDLSRTTIYAPMDGIVITRKVEAGQTVAATMNAPTLFIIANDLTKMQIEAAVSEADVGGLEEGQTVQFIVDAFPGRSFEGKVQQVRYAPTTNQNVITYTTVVAVENKDMKLRPGMTANAKFITAERKNVLTIPTAAARFRPPTGVTVKGDTNAPASGGAAKVALIESGPFAGLPVMPWQTGGERRRPTEDERAAYMASLTPDQKQKYEKAMAEMRARFAQGGGPGGGGFGGGPGGAGGGGFGGGPGGSGGGGERRSAEPEGPKSGTVYVLEKETTPTGAQRNVLKAVPVKMGIGDGTNIEVLEGLKEGDVVVSGTIQSTAAASTGFRNPLGGFGGPPRR
ncbi:MAG TPA: efflux RND transporter periplasmic adaptor subunit [Candidatus Paceibacterota bacterium]|nr:efflux RND transporter periplasmic adaptor subunit [Verrucomicrobiota bacterium]HRY48202.1 efflux RND transporter periplasmic adaptor subunit [Candidatus Paceibacterota bacterium]